jgi:hypothetical protein
MGLQNAEIADWFAADGFHTPHLHERFRTGEIQHLIRRLGLRSRFHHDHRARATSNLASGGWPPSPARSKCRRQPCSDGSNAAGSPVGKTPARSPARCLISIGSFIAVSSTS